MLLSWFNTATRRMMPVYHEMVHLGEILITKATTTELLDIVSGFEAVANIV